VLATQGQNLVRNGSIEDITDCPGVGELAQAEFWNTPNGASPDLFDTCGAPTVSVPRNVFGYQWPRTGKAYSGLVNESNTSNYREYIKTTLEETLEEHKIYVVTYYVNLPVRPWDGGFCASNNLGFGFSSSEIDQPNNKRVTGLEYRTNHELVFDTLEWTEVSWLYQAKGDERFFYLGNFEPEGYTIFIGNVESACSESYYFIDDVSIFLTPITIPNVISPNDDGLNDAFKVNDLPIGSVFSVYDRWGLLKEQQTTSSGDFVWNPASNDTEGVYFWTLETPKQGRLNGYIQLVR